MTLRHGRWQDVLCDVVEVDAVITDPPYSARVHGGDGAKGQSDGANRRTMDYEAWTPDDVAEFVASWSPRTRRWIAALTSHDLCAAYEAAYDAAGWYAFAPVPWVCPGASVRLGGDGPASWTCYLMVARPRTAAAAAWRALPGAYVVQRDRGEAGRYGGKPLSLMRQIVRDYSDPGDLVCDPLAGYGTTLIAALQMGRRAIGAEVDATAYAEALRRTDVVLRQGALL